MTPFMEALRHGRVHGMTARWRAIHAQLQARIKTWNEQMSQVNKVLTKLTVDLAKVYEFKHKPPVQGNETITFETTDIN